MALTIRRAFGALIITLCLAQVIQSQGQRSIEEAKTLLKYKIHLSQKFVNLKNERHRTTKFTFTTLNTELDKPWDELPSVPKTAKRTLEMIRGAIPCPASFQVKIIRFRRTRMRTVCLFKDAFDPSIFEDKLEIDLMKEGVSPEALYGKVFPVSGFLVDEISSVVKGYLVDKYFYGTIKMFDRIRSYHLHFYIEPIENLVLYNTVKYLNREIDRQKGENAILFEYISHEDYFDKYMPPPRTTPTTSPPPTTSTTSTPVTMPQVVVPKGGNLSTSVTVTASPTVTTSQDVVPKGGNVSTSVTVTASPTVTTPLIVVPKEGNSSTSVTVAGTTNTGQALSELTIFQNATTLVTVSGPRNKTLYHSTEATPRSRNMTSTVSVSAVTPTTIFNATSGSASSSTKAVIFHSTEATPRPGWKGRKKRSYLNRAKRNASDPAKSQTTIVKVTDERLIFQDKDIANSVQFKTGLSTADVFDLKMDQSLVCSLCVWIQPNFAEMFGFNGGMALGVSEIIEIIKEADWYFRAMDFNSDGLADNIGFKIRELVISDDIKINASTEQEDKARNSQFFPLMENRLKKRALSDPAPGKGLNELEFDVDNYDVEPGKILEVQDLQYLNEINDSPNDAVMLDSPKAHDKSQIDRMIYTMTAKEAYEGLTPVLQKDQRFLGCCAVLGFIYHNLSPSLTISSIRGTCSKTNIALISGTLHMHKIGKFDILRSVMHTMGHLFGGHHDVTVNSNCKDNRYSNFLNPFLLDPIPQINVGLRPNSMKMSPCARLDIALFLTSPNLSCLRSEESKFCGNGWIDEGEDCDCGSPWQCHLESAQCCGERDSVLGCKRLDTADYRVIKSKKCPRPLIW